MIRTERTDDLGETRTVILYSVSDIAKVLNLKDNKNLPIGRNKLYNILKINHVITRDNQPSQYFMNLGLAEYHGVLKSGKTYYMPVFTEKGLNYIKNGFLSGKYNTFSDLSVFNNKHVVNNDDIF